MEWGLSSKGEEKNVLPETLSWQGLNKYVIPNYTGGLKISSALVDLTWLKVLSVVFVTLATQTPLLSALAKTVCIYRWHLSRC